MSSSESDTEQRNQKRIKDPLELQKHRLDRLFENPSREIRVDRVETKRTDIFETSAFVPIIVQGANYAAGSAQFPLHRLERRKELAQQKLRADEDKEELARREFDDRLRALKAADDRKTARNREKRQKRSQSQLSAKRARTDDAGDAAAAASDK